MKRIQIVSIFLFVAVALTTKAEQTNPTNKELKRITTEWETDWGHLAFVTVAEYWSEHNKRQLLTQLSQSQLDKLILMTSHPKYRPCQMSAFCLSNSNERKKDTDSISQKISKLKIYRVATFINHGLDSFTESMTVICIPYKGNEDWDKEAVWDTVYNMLPTRFVIDYVEGFKPKALPAKFSFPAVTIKTMNNNLFVPAKEYFNEQSNFRMSQISRQIGVEKKTRVVNFFGFKHYKYPPAFLPSGYTNAKSYDEAMRKLKLYKVATYTDPATNDKPGKRYAILRVPYGENKDWNPALKWDANKFETIFLIVPEESISLVVPPKYLEKRIDEKF